MYNHYQGNSGIVRRVPEKDDRLMLPLSTPLTEDKAQDAAGLAAEILSEGPHAAPDAHPLPKRPPPVLKRPPSPLSGISSELGRLLGRLSPMRMETEDLLLFLIIYLMYRESRDEELLYILAAMFFL